MKPEAQPVIQPPRVIPNHLRKKTNNNPNYFVIDPKSSGPDADVRIAADFRLANKGVSRTRIVPVVKIEDLAIGYKIFSKIDLNNGYHQFFHRRRE